MSNLRNRLEVKRCDLNWAQNLVTNHHYLHRPVHPLGLPFAYEIGLDKQTIGAIIMATPHFVKLSGLFGDPGLPTKWQVIQIARLWIEPDYQERQANGHANNLASCAISKVLKRVNGDWLNHHPPRFPHEPHHLKLVIAYADLKAGHLGTVYKAANFREFGRTNSNRNRHGGGDYTGKKILYVYRLEQKYPVAYPVQLSLFDWDSQAG